MLIRLRIAKLLRTPATIMVVPATLEVAGKVEVNHTLCIAYTSRITRTLIMVTVVVNMRNSRSGRIFTKRMPKNAPIKTNGMAQASIASVVRLMLCQAKNWKGSFRKFTQRKNHALVPTKANK